MHKFTQIFSIIVIALFGFACAKQNSVTPLMEASFKGNSEQVSQLIQEGANVNTQGYCNKTALFFAIRGGHTDVIRELLAAGAKVNVLDEEEPLMVSVFGYCWGWSPLMYAIRYGRVNIVKELLAAGADVNLQTANGTTALQLVQEVGNEEIVELLKSAGADVSTVESKIQRNSSSPKDPLFWIQKLTEEDAL